MNRLFCIFIFSAIISTSVMAIPGEIPAGITLQYSRPEPVVFKNRVVPIFMMVVGAGMMGMWSVDMASGKFSGQGNFFRWREGENMLWPHITAEFLTGAGLIAGGIGLYTSKDWGLAISLASLGAVSYSAINSTGWVLAERSRTPYGIPMWVSLTGAVASIVILIN